MIGQGLEFVCPQCGVIRNCIMRERDSEKHIGFKEYYLDCYICHHKFTNSVIDQENERYFKEQKIASLSHRDGLVLLLCKENLFMPMTQKKV